MESTIEYRIRVVTTIEAQRAKIKSPSIQSLLKQNCFYNVTPNTYVKWVSRHKDDLSNFQRNRKRRVTFCDCPLRYMVLTPSIAPILRDFQVMVDELVYELERDGDPFFKEAANTTTSSTNAMGKTSVKKKKGGEGNQIREKKIIKNHEKDNRKDTGRYMTSFLTKHKKDDYHHQIINLLQPLMPNHSLVDLLLLESVQNTPKQQAHIDFNIANVDYCGLCQYKCQSKYNEIEEYSNNESMSYSFLLALYDNTPIYFNYENHMMIPQNKKRGLLLIITKMAIIFLPEKTKSF